MTLALVPLKQRDAKEWVREHHRHSGVPIGDIFRVGVTNDGELCGVGMAGRPVARALDDGKTVELIRVCTDGTPNACSKLYGALIRAARALGFHRVYTYTLTEESGASLKAVGFVLDDTLPPRPTWDTPSRPRATEKRPDGAKYRWRLDLA